jgi:hypothetical protein
MHFSGPVGLSGQKKHFPSSANALIEKAPKAILSANRAADFFICRLQNLRLINYAYAHLCRSDIDRCFRHCQLFLKGIFKASKKSILGNVKSAERN